ncbi:MAG: hypothetical protein GHCLOJNM_02038 [bacterium]|nr:hypothetical protein [bacterium]
METSGWIFLLVSCSFVTILTVYCFWKVLSLPSEVDEDLHAPLDIDTRDLE